MGINMKSEPEDLIKGEPTNVETPCKECSFCEYQDGVQTGCAAGRLEIFKSFNQIARQDSSDNKTYSVIDRFCNYFRSQKWKKDNQEENLLEAVKKETTCGFGLAINCKDHTPEKIKTTLESLKNIDYDQARITVVFYVDGSKNISHLVHLVNELKKIYYKVILVSNSQEKNHIKEYDIFSKCCDKTHFTTCNIGCVIPKGMFSAIDSCINLELAKIVYFESSDTTTVQIKLVRRVYLEYLNYNKMLEDIKIISKTNNMYGWYEEKE